MGKHRPLDILNSKCGIWCQDTFLVDLSNHFLYLIDLIFCSVVDGAWTDWGSYGSCSVTCGGGTQIRRRSCTNPAPSILGEDCAGPSNSSRECNTQICPSKKFYLFLSMLRSFTANKNVTQTENIDILKDCPYQKISFYVTCIR
jgi:hypothetical protein